MSGRRNLDRRHRWCCSLDHEPLSGTRASQQIPDLRQQLAAAKTPRAKTALQRDIDTTDRQIDRLVYKLYDLTDEETLTAEEATRY